MFITIPKAELEGLLCEKTVMVGEFPITIKAATLRKLPSLTIQVQRLYSILQDRGIDLSNFKDNISIILEILLDEFISLYETLTNISRDSLESLPASIHFELITAVVEVNYLSQDQFVKNFNSLTDVIKRVKAQYQHQ